MADTPHRDAPRWLLPAWLHGALVGAWSLGLVWAYDVALGRGFGVLDPERLRRIIGPELWLAVAAPRWNVPLLQSIELAFVAAVLAGMLLGAIFGWIGRKLDPHRESREAFWWPVRRVRGFWPVALVAPVAMYLSVQYADRIAPWSIAVAAVMAVAFLLLPFGILQRDALFSIDGSGWWRPRWIGFPALVAFVVLFIGDFLLDYLPLPWWAREAKGSVVDPALTFACAAVVVERLSLRQLAAARRQILGIRPVAAAIVLDARCAVFALWTAAPILLGACFMVFDAPSLHMILKADGNLDAVLALSVPVALIDGWVRYWWLVVPFPAMLMCWLAFGRLYVRLSARRT